MGPRWYVVRTKPRSEVLAASELDLDGIEVFSPLVKKPHAGAGPGVAPLFPGYMFIRFDAETDGWPSFRFGRFGQHVLGWVNFRGEVPWLPDEVVAELKQRCDRINQQGGIWRRYRTGERVHVASSSIQSLAQVVEDGKTPQSRVKVLLEFMDRLVPAQVSRENLQPIEDAPAGRVHAPRRTRGSRRWIQGFGPRALAAG